MTELKLGLLLFRSDVLAALRARDWTTLRDTLERNRARVRCPAQEWEGLLADPSALQETLYTQVAAEPLLEPLHAEARAWLAAHRGWRGRERAGVAA